jgi:hypothetical protein
MKAYGSGCIDPHFPDLGTSWRWVVSFTPRPFYHQGKPRYLLDRRLGWPQSRSGRRGAEKIRDPTGTRTPTPRSSSPYPVAIATALSTVLHIFLLLPCVLHTPPISLSLILFALKLFGDEYGPTNYEAPLYVFSSVLYLYSLKSKHSHQHHVFKYPQSYILS